MVLPRFMPLVKRDPRAALGKVQAGAGAVRFHGENEKSFFMGSGEDQGEILLS